MSLPFDTLKPRGAACIVDIGCSAMVSIYMDDDCFVLKGSEVWLNGRCYGRTGNVDSQKTLALEDTIYQRLGPHPHILKYDGKLLVREDTYSLKLERALGNLRNLILACPVPAEQTRLKMAMQISCGMAHAHSRNVFHCDFSCRNVLVFTDWLLKIGDFGGSKIDDQEPLAGEETRYQLPLRGRKWEVLDYTKREIFALGCGIYEIMAWKAPFPEMTEKQISKKYAARAPAPSPKHCSSFGSRTRCGTSDFLASLKRIAESLSATVPALWPKAKKPNIIPPMS